MDLAQATFTEDDGNLFRVDDPQLRAEALRYSILPRMTIPMNEAIALVKDIFNIDVLNDSIISMYPNFRKNRPTKLTHYYESAFVGLGGRRTKNNWKGFSRKDGREVQILPFRFGFQLTEDGLDLLLENNWVKGLTPESYRKILKFHIDYEPLTCALCLWTRIGPMLFHGDGCSPIASLGDHYRFMAENDIFDNTFLSLTSIPFPISREQLETAISSYILFFPIYDSYIQMALGNPTRFEELVEKANAWVVSWIDDENTSKQPVNASAEGFGADYDLKAEKRIKVMPALRWQVFKRDNWKCASCGRGAHDDIILQIDHIVPRSKGGGTTLDNLQTLCHVCNIGKSNKDDTDLRNSSAG
ncbi:MAG: HNH endonuclease [Pseudomonadota bacterium]